MGKMQQQWFIGKVTFFVFFVFVALLMCVDGVVAGGQKNHAAASGSNTRYTIDVPAQNAITAFSQLAEQTGIDFIFPYDIAATRVTKRVAGRYTVMEALTIMLQYSGLSSGLSDKGAIRIFISDGSDNNLEGMVDMNAKKKLLAGVIGFFVAGGAPGVLAQDDGGEGEAWLLEEIVVTATRREVSLQDTALSIAAIGGEEIDRRNIAGMGDYLSAIPGVNMLDLGIGANHLIVRGIAADPAGEGNTNGPSVGTYFGEVPVSGFGSLGGSADPKLVDMERVEVLRGPQGTLYGANSLAGAVRNIPKSPNLQALEGNIKTTYSNTSSKGGDNIKIEGVINIPVIKDIFAVRAVAYRHDNSGYIDNIAASDPVLIEHTTAVGAEDLLVNQDDMGATEFTGGRIAVLWRPSDQLSVNLQYVTQNGEQKGDLNQTDESFAQTRLRFPEALGGGSEGLEQELDFTNLVVEYDFGWANLLSSSAWMEQENISRSDLTVFFLPFIPTLRGTHFTENVFSSNAFIQEVRLVSELESPLQYLVGLYYEDIETLSVGEAHAGGDPSLDFRGEPFGPGNSKRQDSSRSLDTQQQAVFGEVTYEFTEQIEFTLGARWFDYERERGYEANFSLAGGQPFTHAKTSESDINYKANISYQPNDNMLFYAQWSEGFRLGGLSFAPIPASQCDVDNDGVLDSTNIPFTEEFKSDTLDNFELGAKLSLKENRLQINASIYQIDWDGVPLTVRATTPTCFNAIPVNAGEAVSRGVEIETQFYLTQDLRVDLGATYKNAEFTSDSAPAGVADRDRLPGSADYNAYARLQYEFELSGYSAFVRGDYSYMGGYFDNLQETGEELGDYEIFNITAGITIGQINLDIFANNLTNADETIWIHGAFPDKRGFHLRPRTIGINVGYQF